MQRPCFHAVIIAPAANTVGLNAQTCTHRNRCWHWTEPSLWLFSSLTSNVSVGVYLLCTAAIELIQCSKQDKAIGCSHKSLLMCRSTSHTSLTLKSSFPGLLDLATLSCPPSTLTLSASNQVHRALSPGALSLEPTPTTSQPMQPP